MMNEIEQETFSKALKFWLIKSVLRFLFLEKSRQSIASYNRAFERGVCGKIFDKVV